MIYGLWKRPEMLLRYNKHMIRTGLADDIVEFFSKYKTSIQRLGLTEFRQYLADNPESEMKESIDDLCLNFDCRMLLGTFGAEGFLIIG